MYERQSRLDYDTQYNLTWEFVAGRTGREAAYWVGVHRNTAVSYYSRLRKVIAEETEKMRKKALPVGGEIEAQVISFNTVCKGKSGPGDGVDANCLVLYNRLGSAYATAIANTRAPTLMSIMERSILPGSIVYTDYSPKYNALDNSDFTHVRQYSDLYGVHHFSEEVDLFFERFHGVPNQSFPLFLRELEWRFNLDDEQKLCSQLWGWVLDRQEFT